MTQRHWSSNELDALHAEIAASASRAALDATTWELEHQAENGAARSALLRRGTYDHVARWFAACVMAACLLAAVIAALISFGDRESSSTGFEQEARQEEAIYRAARGDLERLTSYIQSCSACVFKAEAEAEIGNLQRDQRAQREKREYEEAHGNLDLLRSYVASCEVCAFAARANADIAELEKQAQYVSFQVCNLTAFRASIAASGRRTAVSAQFTVEGWWDVAAGACVPLGRYVKGKVYAMARVRDDTLGWRGSAAKICVTLRGPFERIVLRGYKCGASERLESFLMFSVREDYTWRLDEEPTVAPKQFVPSPR